MFLDISKLSIKSIVKTFNLIKELNLSNTRHQLLRYYFSFYKLKKMLGLQCFLKKSLSNFYYDYQLLFLYVENHKLTF